MPTRPPLLSDPTNLVVQGEEMRRAALLAPVCSTCPVIGATAPPFGGVLLAGEQSVAPMQMDFSLPFEARVPARGRPRANAGISLPNGEFLEINPLECLVRVFVQATERFNIVGVTRDSAGAPLGSCDVIAFEPGRLVPEGSPFVGQTTSDGSGNYTIFTAGNGAHQVIAYKSGPVAGISLNTLTPTQV